MHQNFYYKVHVILQSIRGKEVLETAPVDPLRLCRVRIHNGQAGRVYSRCVIRCTRPALCETVHGRPCASLPFVYAYGRPCV